MLRRGIEQLNQAVCCHQWKLITFPIINPAIHTIWNSFDIFDRNRMYPKQEVNIGAKGAFPFIAHHQCRYLCAICFQLKYTFKSKSITIQHMFILTNASHLTIGAGYSQFHLAGERKLHNPSYEFCHYFISGPFGHGEWVEIGETWPQPKIIGWTLTWFFPLTGTTNGPSRNKTHSLFP